MGGDDHRAASSLRYHNVNEVIHGSRPEGGSADVLIADRGAAERWVKDDICTAQGQAVRRLRKDHVVTDQHTNRAKIRRREHGKVLASLPRLVDCRLHLNVASNDLAIPPEEKSGVSQGTVGTEDIVAAYQVHPMPGSRFSQSLKHSFYRLGKNSVQIATIRRLPFQNAQRVLRK